MNYGTEKVAIKMRHEIELLELELKKLKKEEHYDSRLKDFLVHQTELEVEMKKYLLEKYKKLNGWSD